MEAPEFFQGSYCSQFTQEKHLHSLDSKSNGGEHFIVEDLLDFSNDDDAVAPDGTTPPFETVTGNSTDSSTITVVDTCNSSSLSGCEPSFNADIGTRNLADGQFSGDLCVPYDDLAELEWLSNFVEESFSSEDLQKLQLISGMHTRPNEASETRPFQPEPDGQLLMSADSNNNVPTFHPEMSVPAKARSKRSRAAPCNWASRLLVLSPTSSSSEPTPEFILPAPHPTSGKKTVKATASKKKDSVEVGGGGDGRKCLHCATDKTPQWRTGPMGPKTLCNACGVRYKSGRLVPEYRPAASPTFVLTKHSNSHRKVLELRRQKDMMRAQQHQQHQFLHHHQNMMYDVSNGDDYLIHQHVGPDYRQMI
ncbi:GATA transcription factor 12 [Tripterygium wilfordii]|uniref:GATA transcription factor n=1 Tax=Tripterygium wilfordii TaxID=458696 RepID=A0A7J7DAB6_TRIWF|nr:GATA transcription factor 12-like [Tripterygium wilfordii]KAF5743234.1 GATA transcription factor 12 [Tripterygium wilfordii]